MLNRVGKALRIISDEDKKGIAVILDGPTLLDEFQLSKFKSLKKSLNQIGTIRSGKVITDRQITQKESNILQNQGFQEEIVGSDVDIHITIRALELLANKSIDVVAIGTSDSNLFPVLSRIKKNKNLAVILWEKDLTPAIESLADYILYLDYLR